MTSKLRITFVAVYVLAAVSIGISQGTTARLAGIVQDSTGAVLPGVEASLTNEGTSTALQTVTNESGEFLFDFIPAGTYTLKLALPGFKGFESRGIPLGAAQSLRRT
jgi:Carboxypeptidase regulatory-like domain